MKYTGVLQLSAILMFSPSFTTLKSNHNKNVEGLPTRINDFYGCLRRQKEQKKVKLTISRCSFVYPKYITLKIIKCKLNFSSKKTRFKTYIERIMKDNNLYCFYVTKIHSHYK